MQQKFAWNIAKPEKSAVDEIAATLGLPLPITRAIANRGIDTAEKAEGYVTPSASHVHDPFLLNDMEKAVDRALLALERKERVLVLGDYDVDGISGTALLVSFLSRIGVNVNYYIPNREKEGYGLNENVVRKSSSAGYKLIITVDSGVSSIKEAALAKSLGMDMIITDHHEPHAVAPDVLALVNQIGRAHV